MYDGYARFTVLLRIKFYIIFQDGRLCEEIFGVFIALFNVDAERPHEDLQMELIQMQNDSILQLKFIEVVMPIFSQVPVWKNYTK
jgi:hypothetical protein